MTHKTIDKRASQAFEEIQGMSPLEAIKKRSSVNRAALLFGLAAALAAPVEGFESRREKPLAAPHKASASKRRARKLQRKARRRSRA